MTFTQPPVFVNGGTHPARVARMALRGLTRELEGIEQGDDLKVLQLAAAGGSVRITDGAAWITGRRSRWQGVYHAYNIGDLMVPIAPTGVSARADLIVARVEDPEHEGVRNPATDEIVYVQVVPGVSALQTTVPDALWTAIPLARLNIPANTTAITQGMITDLRRIADPRRDRRLLIAQHGADQNTSTTNNLWLDWPSSAAWDVAIPSWATEAKVRIDVAGAQLINGSFFGSFRPVLGGLFGQNITVDLDWVGSSIRANLLAADNLGIPPADRGFVRRLKAQALRAGLTGSLQADTGTTIVADIEFLEGLR